MKIHHPFLNLEQQELLDNIKDYSKTMCEFYQNNSKHKDSLGLEVWETQVYASILKYGVVGIGTSIPKKQKGIMKQCFANSQKKIINDGTDLIYCEGIAIQADLGLPIHHGWLMNSKGEVKDYTWEHPETAIYLGVPFNSEFIREQVLKTKMWSSLFSGENFRPTILDRTPEDFIHPLYLKSLSQKAEQEWDSIKSSIVTPKKSNQLKL